ncbi:MAG: hypothetical protein VX438_15270, partial [Planctomycetota bacterium]|nr:hypothetical protein [Planctomycetota bacterium]
SVAMAPLPLEKNPPASTAQQITFKNISINPGKLLRMRLFRDIYYFKKSPSVSSRLGKDEFYVVGDNVPVSKDSRNSAIYPKKSEILGIVN